MTPPIEILLASLEGVKRTSAPNKWIARCPAHGDKHPSLSIAITDEGKILLHCWSGCGAAEVVGAVGLTLADLFPSRTEPSGAKRLTVPASDILRAIRRELYAITLAVAAIHREGLTAAVDARLEMATQRILSAINAAGV